MTASGPSSPRRSAASRTVEAPGWAGLPAHGAQAELSRFDVVERAVHWSTAVLLIALLVTGAILYVPSLALAVGHRAIVEQLHVVCGLAMFGPLVLGLAGPWRRRLLSDLRHFDRWTPTDWAWFRPGGARRRPGRRNKFNGGQKAEALLISGGMVAMLLTGVVMRWSPPFPNRWATGATFVHDWGFFALALALTAHVVVALSRPDQFRAMLTGRIPRSWARAHAPAWLDEIEAVEAIEAVEQAEPGDSGAPAHPAGAPAHPAGAPAHPAGAPAHPAGGAGLGARSASPPH